MASVLNNYSALNAQRNLNQSRMGLEQTLGRLSSGIRINRASDDPAGLGISNSLRADIRALQQGVKNAFEGVNILQTVDTNLDEMTNLVTRALTLAEQAASDTSGGDHTPGTPGSGSGKAALDSEYQGILSEIDRLASSTEFIGRNLLADDTNAVVQMTIEVATSAQQSDASNRITISIARSTTAGLGLTGNLQTSANARAEMDNMKTAINTLSSNRVGVGVGMSRLQAAASASAATAENLQSAESGIRDADMSHEIVQLTKFQILQQTGTVALAQANAAQQMVMQLLR